MTDCLIGVTAPFSIGLVRFAKNITPLKRLLDISAVSSCYAVVEESQQRDYCIAFRCQSRLSSEELISELKLEEVRAEFKVRFLLLGFADAVKMDPLVTLPHPRLARDDVMLQVCYEVWPSYQHPILQVPLSQLVSDSRASAKFDFIAAGHQILAGDQ